MDRESLVRCVAGEGGREGNELKRVRSRAGVEGGELTPSVGAETHGA